MTAPDALDALPDVARLTVHAGQVLVYPRHTPPGVFVVSSGSLCRFGEGTVPAPGCGRRFDAAGGRFAVPAPEELGAPAATGVLAETDVELLFIPRSVVIEGTAVADALAAAGVTVVRLGETGPGGGVAVTRGRAR